MDKIIIKDLHVQTIIGIRERERHNAQDIIINLTAFTRHRPVEAPDDISVCLDYSELGKHIRSMTMSAQRYTLEALAEDIAVLCLGFPIITKVIVKVEKPAAISGAASAGIEIERRRNGSKL